MRKLFARIRRSTWVALAIVVAVMACVGFLPLFNGPGYEFSVAAGLVVPTISAVVGAIGGFDGPRHAAARSPLGLMTHGAAKGGGLAVAALAVSLVHGARSGFCAPLSGIATYVLTAWCGAVLAGAAGVLVSLLVAHAMPQTMARRRVAIAMSLCVPLGSVGVAIGQFYWTPAIFAFDPFVGYFSGTLYDEVVDAYALLLTYRSGTVLTLAALVFCAAALQRDFSGRLRWCSRRLAVAAAACAIASGVLVGLGGALGHRTTASKLRAALGAERHGSRCDVYFPRTVDDVDAELFVRDCEEALASVERRLAIQGPPRVTAFFFSDASQKRSLIGAADTYVAKPWRREVYLQLAHYPHPVLAHELAHVVAGQAARGPFSVAGDWFGLLPNPGLIEGIAVAAAPEREELTPAQWAAAMKEIGILPPLARIFGAAFLAQNSSTAYTVAGAFVSYQLDSGRGDAVRSWYGGATFNEAFGISLSEAEAAWKTSLSLVPLPPLARQIAKARFDRPAIWGRRCPHVVARLRAEAVGCRDSGDLARASHVFGEILKYDVADPSSRIERAKLALKRGDSDAYRQGVQALIDDSRVSLLWRNRARESLADELLRQGDFEEARRLYALARSEVLDEDWARGLDVKSYVARSPSRDSGFRRLLVGSGRRQDDTTPALLELGQLLARTDVTSTDLALARYLAGRRLVDARSYEQGEALLLASYVPELGDISPRLQREAARLLVHTACMRPGRERPTRTTEAYARYLKAPRAGIGEQEWIERFVERCRQLR